MQEVLLLEHISRHFKVGTQVVKALRDITLTVNNGEYVALMGTSGSGKSTLMNILGCLDTPTGGKYVLNNHDVSKLKDDQLAEIRNKEIGFIFQSHHLLSEFTILENLLIPLQLSKLKANDFKELAIEVLDKVGLLAKLDSYPASLSMH